VVSFRSLSVSRRRIAALLIALVVVAAAAGAYAYFSSLSAMRGPRVSLISLPVQLSMELDKAEYQQDENITVTLTLENKGNASLTIAVNPSIPFQRHPPPLLFDLEIMNGNGTTMGTFSQGWYTLYSSYEYTLSPGESLSQTLVWVQSTKYLVSGEYQGGQLPPGSYSIRGMTPPSNGGMGISIGSQPYTSYETPSITFVIT
jgi:hypothetical protein